MNLWLSSVIFMTILTLLSGCADVSDKEISFNAAKSMPGYGYLIFDFRESREIKNIKDNRLYYTIHYTNENKSIFVTVNDVDFKERLFKAYIPYYKGYKVRSISSALLSLDCGDCQRTPIDYWVSVYLVSAVGGSRCQETVHKNFEMFDYTDGCNGDWRDENGIDGSKRFLGSVFITPHFNTGSVDTFTNRYPPGHSSAGS